MDFRKYIRFIRIEHSIFSLPFAYVGVALAGAFSLRVLLLVAIAATAARTSGFAMNRLMDLPMDRLNPRYAKRELVSGSMSIGEARGILLSATAAFLASAYLLNTAAFLISPIMVLAFYLYNRTKKLIAVSHIFLGFAIGFVVIAGYVAGSGALPVAPAPYLFMIFYAFWMAGFDVIYQNQDMKFDLGMGIRSIPVLTKGKITPFLLLFYTIASVAIFIAASGALELASAAAVSLLMFASIPFVGRIGVDDIFKYFNAPVPLVVLLFLVLRILL